MSDTRYWLMVLLIPMLGVWFLGVGMGTTEVLVWLALAVAWVVAFVNHDRIKPRVPLIALGVMVAVGIGLTVLHQTTDVREGYATVDPAPPHR